ncbi:MAG: choline kinase family protein [Rubrobacteraceae bacterium]
MNGFQKGDDLSQAYAALGRLTMFAAAPPEEVEISRLSNSFTNSSYRVDINGDSFLLRLSGKDSSEYIDRAAEEYNARIAARLGVNAEVLFFDAADGTMVCRFLEGVGMDAESFLRDPTAPARAALALRRIHASGRAFKHRFDPFEKIEAYLDLLRELRSPLPNDLDEVLKEAWSACWALDSLSIPLAPCHNDPWPGNFVDSGGRMRLVDWEYSGMNDPMWDLADLSVEAGLSPSREWAMLEAYFEGPPPEDASLRLAVYKVMSDLLWSLWALLQNANGNQAEDFFAYALVRYERCKRAMEDGFRGCHSPRRPRRASRQGFREGGVGELRRR